MVRNYKCLLVFICYIVAQNLLYKSYGCTLQFLCFFVLISFLTFIALIDFKSLEISNKLIIIFYVVTFIAFPFNDMVTIIRAAIGFVVMFLTLFALSKISKEALGMGDVFIISALGVWLGIDMVLSTLFISSIFSAGYGGFMILKNKENKSKSMAFIPFILLGTIFSLLLN